MLAFRDRVRGGQLNPSNWGPHQSKILLVLAIDLLLVLYFTSRSGSVLSWLGAGSESDESAQTSWSSRVLGTFQYHLKAPTTTRDLQRALIEDYKAGRWTRHPIWIRESAWSSNTLFTGGVREMPKWNSTLLLVELLRMPLGMMIVGDSVSKQHFEGYFHLLGIRSGIVRVASQGNDVGFEDHLTMHLNSDHPIAKEAIAIAGVAPESAGETRHHTNQTFPKGPIAYYDWLADLGEPLRKATEAAREYGAKVSKSVVVLSTGAHWTNHELPLDDPAIHDMYAGMMDLTFRKLGALSMSDSISVMYRATAPGHYKCTTFTTPIPAEEAAIREKRVRFYKGVRSVRHFSSSPPRVTCPGNRSQNRD
ncbi:hypothetical protein JCM24511_03138 [Saitozyma sp. JCM 24511]|nr:hypothetical protein JCM24511_03138 [Saitozyma sp. JCM 24511]